uniref:EF-hand domain-containing protein n=1 Tax=Phaeomonas parva TaxID=124430 RepID=A0A7S1XWY9_9STRA|mmetsp:Transcript_40256/g.125939  ORF Transcript_40256/g.125939 Transcript_40256/m.125939 type:complete len:1096 (+) Transcript_40256:178-3465(+)
MGDATEEAAAPPPAANGDILSAPLNIALEFNFADAGEPRRTTNEKYQALLEDMKRSSDHRRELTPRGVAEGRRLASLYGSSMASNHVRHRAVNVSRVYKKVPRKSMGDHGNRLDAKEEKVPYTRHDLDTALHKVSDAAGKLEWSEENPFKNFEKLELDVSDLRDLFFKNFRLRLTIAEASALLDFFDHDDNGGVDYAEFLTTFLKLNVSEREKQHKQQVLDGIRAQERIARFKARYDARFKAPVAEMAETYTEVDRNRALQKIARAAGDHDPMRDGGLTSLGMELMYPTAFKELLRRQFHVKVNAAELKALMDYFDADGNGAIDPTEFLSAFMRAGREAREEKKKRKEEEARQITRRKKLRALNRKPGRRKQRRQTVSVDPESANRQVNFSLASRDPFGTPPRKDTTHSDDDHNWDVVHDIHERRRPPKPVRGTVTFSDDTKMSSLEYRKRRRKPLPEAASEFDPTFGGRLPEREVKMVKKKHARLVLKKRGPVIRQSGGATLLRTSTPSTGVRTALAKSGGLMKLLEGMDRSDLSEEARKLLASRGTTGGIPIGRLAAADFMDKDFTAHPSFRRFTKHHKKHLSSRKNAVHGKIEAIKNADRDDDGWPEPLPSVQDSEEESQVERRNRRRQNRRRRRQEAERRLKGKDIDRATKTNVLRYDVRWLAVKEVYSVVDSISHDESAMCVSLIKRNTTYVPEEMRWITRAHFLTAMQEEYGPNISDQAINRLFSTFDHNRTGRAWTPEIAVIFAFATRRQPFASGREVCLYIMEILAEFWAGCEAAAAQKVVTDHTTDNVGDSLFASVGTLPALKDHNKRSGTLNAKNGSLAKQVEDTNANDGDDDWTAHLNAAMQAREKARAASSVKEQKSRLVRQNTETSVLQETLVSLEDVLRAIRSIAVSPGGEDDIDELCRRSFRQLVSETQAKHHDGNTVDPELPVQVAQSLPTNTSSYSESLSSLVGDGHFLDKISVVTVGTGDLSKVELSFVQFEFCLRNGDWADAMEAVLKNYKQMFKNMHSRNVEEAQLENYRSERRVRLLKTKKGREARSRLLSNKKNSARRFHMSKRFGAQNAGASPTKRLDSRSPTMKSFGSFPR